MSFKEILPKNWESDEKEEDKNENGVIVFTKILLRHET